MKNKLWMLAVAATVITTISSCAKKDAAKDRDAILGTYNFTNTYEYYNFNNYPKIDTIRGTETYVITLDKPTPDTLGENVVRVYNLTKRVPNNVGVLALSSSGEALNALLSPGDIEFDSFLGLIEDGKIELNFKAYYGGPCSGMSCLESGKGTAVKK